MNQDEFISQIKQAVHEVEAAADIILYGSRSRGDARRESDCDKMEQGFGIISYEPRRRDSGRCSYPCLMQGVGMPV